MGTGSFENQVFYYSNIFRAIAERVAFTLYRTAHSTFVKETEDFSIGILDRFGRTVAVPVELGVTWFAGLDYGPVLDNQIVPTDGDVFCTNDPYEGNVSTHAPDLHMWRPVVVDGEVLCYVAGHVHNTDVGGAVPASVSKALTEVQQEGVRIGPVKIFSEKDGWNKEVTNVFLKNVRKPEQNFGDMRAMAGALEIGARELKSLIARLGKEHFAEACELLISHSKKQTQQFIRTVPNGTYDFWDYCDSDSVGGPPLRIRLKLVVNDDTITLDFTGTDPQAASSLNIPTGGYPRHTLILVAVYYVLFSFNKDLLLNIGMTLPFTCILPEGSVLNCKFPAAVGMRSLTGNRVRTVIFGAFAKALPDRMPAAASGAGSMVNVMAYDRRKNAHVVTAIAPVVGGAGGGPDAAGSQGSGADAGYLKNTPVEMIENEVPIHIHRYGLADGSGGAGKYRGGDATMIEFEVLEPDTRITIRNVDRRQFQSWGLNGGQPGANAEIIVTSRGKRVALGRDQDSFVCQPGDVVLVRGSAGGGWGVSEAVKGVQTKTVGLFTLGSYREQYERRYSDATYEKLTTFLYSIPLSWRQFIKNNCLENSATPDGAEVSDEMVSVQLAKKIGVLADTYKLR